MFDQVCFEQYGQFQAEKLGDIETDMLFREVCRNGGESKFLLLGESTEVEVLQSVRSSPDSSVTFTWLLSVFTLNLAVLVCRWYVCILD